MSFHIPPAELVKKMEDLFAKAQKWQSSVFSSFLSEGEIVVLQPFLQRRADFKLYGGYQDAQRKILGVSSEGEIPLEEFPIIPITMKYRAQDKVAHKDVLGSLMGMQIRRDCIGDILVEEGKTVVFVKKPIDSLVLQMKKIGRVGITVYEGAEFSDNWKTSFIEKSGAVASNRLDAMVGFVCRVSRKEAAALILKGLVTVNDQEATSVSSSLQEGDILSVRGHGRYRFGGIRNQTKKGRLGIMFKQYV